MQLRTPLPASESTWERLFSPAGIASQYAVLSLLVISGNLFVKWSSRLLFDGVFVPEYWPVSVFNFYPLSYPLSYEVLQLLDRQFGIVLISVPAPRYPLGPFSLAIPVIALLTASYLFWSVVPSNRELTTEREFLYFGAVLVSLVVLSNLVKGIQWGFFEPVSGPHQYLTTAKDVEGVIGFLVTYNETQVTLSKHAAVHPPGPVIVYYLLYSVFKHAGGTGALVSLSLGIISSGLSLRWLYGILIETYDSTTTHFGLLLFVSIPAVQIYYVSTIDGLITALVIGVVYYLTRDSKIHSTVGLTVTFFFASFLTFTSLVLLPVFLAVAVLDRRKAGVVLGAGLGVGLLYGLLFLFGFSYPASFLTATTHQFNEVGPVALHGKGLVGAAAAYLYTRIENVLEIILFFTPPLCVLSVFGLDKLRSHRTLVTVTITGVLSLTCLFIAGGYPSGETARSAMFVYPLLLFPVVAAFDDLERRSVDRNLLAAVVFGQGLLMQVIGWYKW